MSKKIVSYISIALFIAILILPTLLFISVGKGSESTLNEKRELQAFPKLKRGFFPAFDSWYKDHTPYRSLMIGSYNRVNQRMSALYSHTFEPMLSAAFTPAWFDKSNGVYIAPRIENKAIYGLDDWLFYSGDNSIGFYEGTNILSDEDMKLLSDKFKALNAKCRQKGIDLIYAVPPNKEQVFPEYMPSINVKTEYKREQVFEAYMKANSDVHFIYLLDEMKTMKPLYTPYFKQDTHWNSAGAFAGIMGIYKELGYPYSLIDDVKVTTIRKTGGDLSNMCGYSSEYDDYIVDYRPDITYEVEEYSDGKSDKFTSTNKNGKTALLIGDSFREASKYILAKDYEHTYVCHRSNISDELIVNAMKNLKAGDLVIIMAVERYDYSNSEVTDFINGVI